MACQFFHHANAEDSFLVGVMKNVNARKRKEDVSNKVGH
jgi:hypothetical protein